MPLALSRRASCARALRFTVLSLGDHKVVEVTADRYRYLALLAAVCAAARSRCWANSMKLQWSTNTLHWTWRQRLEALMTSVCAVHLHSFVVLSPCSVAGGGRWTSTHHGGDGETGCGSVQSAYGGNLGSKQIDDARQCASIWPCTVCPNEGTAAAPLMHCIHAFVEGLALMHPTWPATVTALVCGAAILVHCAFGAFCLFMLDM